MENCRKMFKNISDLQEHVDDYHHKIGHHCSICKIHVQYRSSMSKHFRSKKCGGERVKGKPPSGGNAASGGNEASGGKVVAKVDASTQTVDEGKCKKKKNYSNTYQTKFCFVLDFSADDFRLMLADVRAKLAAAEERERENREVNNVADELANMSIAGQHSSEIKFFIRNVVSKYEVGLKLELREICKRLQNVIYVGRYLEIRLQSPKTTAWVFSSGKIMCMGAASVNEVYILNIFMLHVYYICFVLF